MDLGLKYKRIVVSGAANGIGSAIVVSLLREGAYPIGIDKEAFKDSELEHHIHKSGLEPIFQFVQADVSDTDAISNTYLQLESLYGLVNNAGLLGGDQSHGGRTVEAWNKMMDNNAKSAYFLIESSISKMSDGGSIVNMGSLEIDMAAPEVVLNTASKGALFGLTIAYSTTLADKRIRVNMVSPGNVNTQRNLAQYSQHQDLIKGFENRTPLKRSVEPIEVAELVVFLLSNRSSAITGQNYRIDCGYHRALWDPQWLAQDLRGVYK